MLLSLSGCLKKVFVQKVSCIWECYIVKSEPLSLEDKGGAPLKSYRISDEYLGKHPL